MMKPLMANGKCSLHLLMPSPGDVIYETPSNVVEDSSPDSSQDTSYEVVENVPPHEVVQNVPPHEVQR